MKTAMMALSKTNSIKLKPRQYWALLSFIDEHPSLQCAADKIGISKQLLRKVARTRTGSDSTILYVIDAIGPRIEELLAQRILLLVSEAWEIEIDSLTEIKERRQIGELVEPCQVACYLMRYRTKNTLDKIAKILGYASKQNAVYAANQIEVIIQTDKTLRGKIAEVEKSIKW